LQANFPFDLFLTCKVYIYFLATLTLTEHTPSKLLPVPHLQPFAPTFILFNSVDCTNSQSA
jgi:hypothetical protein